MWPQLVTTEARRRVGGVAAVVAPAAGVDDAQGVHGAIAIVIEV